MKSKIKVILPLCLLLLLVVPAISHAVFDGLVICGRSGSGTGSTPCTAPLLVNGTVKIVNFLIDSATLLAIAYVFYGGVNMVLSRGNTAAYDAAKKTMSSAIQGLIIVLIAYLIVSFAIAFLTGGKTLKEILNFIPTPTSTAPTK